MPYDGVREVDNVDNVDIWGGRWPKELVRDGKTVYYITVPDGHVHPRLRTIESTDKQELVEFLIRNRYA